MPIQAIAGKTETVSRQSKSRTAVPLVTSFLYITLLAGEYNLTRAGLPSFLPPPLSERLLASLFLMLLVLPVLTRRRKGLNLIPVFIAPVYVLVTYTWSPVSQENHLAAVDVTTMILLTVVASFLVREDRHKTISTFLWLVFISGIVFAIGGLATGGDRVAAFGGGPNVYSRVTGMGIVGLLWLVGTRRLSTRWLILMPILVAATVLSGSRGGMGATLVALLFIAPSFYQQNRSRAVAGMVIIGAVALIVFYFLGFRILQVVNQRVIELTFEQQYSSGRGQLVDRAFQLIKTEPVLGVGLHGFSAPLESGRTASYPHNMLLQHWVEGGFLGILTLLISVCFFLALTFRMRHNFTGRTVGACGILILVAQQFSGDYYDQRFFWIFYVFIVALFASGQYVGTGVRPSTTHE